MTALSPEAIAETIYVKACEAKRGWNPTVTPPRLTNDQKWAAAVIAWGQFRADYRRSLKRHGEWHEVCEGMDAKVQAYALEGGDGGVSVWADYCDDFQYVWDVLEAMGAVWEIPDEAQDEDDWQCGGGETDAIEEVMDMVNSPGFERR